MGANQLGIFFGLLAGAFWGFSFLIPRLIPGVLPSQIALGRFLWFGVLSLVTLIFQNGFRKNAPIFRFWKEALFLSLSGYSLYYFLLVIALDHIGIPLTSLIVGLIPVTVALLSRDPVKRPKLFYASLAAILFGMGILNRSAFLAESSFWHSGSAVGIGLALLCLALWTYFALSNGRFLKAHPEIRSNEWASILGVFTVSASLILEFSISAFGSNVGSIFEGEKSQTALISYFDPKFLIGTAFLGIFSTYFATRLWNRASLILPMGLVAQLIVSETLFALIYHFSYERIFPEPLEWVGMILILGGVLGAIRAYPIFDANSV